MHQLFIFEHEPTFRPIHEKYIEKLPIPMLCTYCYTTNDLKEKLAKKEFDLLFLNFHSIDKEEIKLLNWLLTNGYSRHMILTVNNQEKQKLRSQFAETTWYFLDKPYVYTGFEEAFLDWYTTEQNRPLKKAKLTSTPLQLFHHTQNKKLYIEKGITEPALKRIVQQILQIKRDFTICDLVNELGFSHVTIRKYVLYLANQNILSSKLIYQKVGRPYHCYSLIDSKHPLVKKCMTETSWRFRS